MIKLEHSSLELLYAREWWLELIAASGWQLVDVSQAPLLWYRS